MTSKLKKAFNTIGRKGKSNESKSENSCAIDANEVKGTEDICDDWTQSNIWRKSSASWNLPLELWIEILVISSDIKTIQNFSCTCKHFYKITSTRDEIYEHIFLKRRNIQKAVLCGVYKWKDLFVRKQICHSVMHCLDRVESHLSKQERALSGIASYLGSYVYMCDLEIPIIPAKLFQLKSLTRLNMTRNHMQLVPKQISQLINLNTLNLASNELDTLPESMTALQKLETLILSQNKFTEIAVAPICKLTSLKKLVFANNAIRALPSQLADLQNLEHLSLTNNLIEDSKENLEVMRKLDGTQFLLDGNAGEWSSWGLNLLMFVPNPTLRDNTS